MEALTLGEVLGWIRDLGSLAIMALIIWWGVQEQPKWVPGSMHRKAMQDMDESCQKTLRDKDTQHARELKGHEDRDRNAWRERDEQMQRVLEERDMFRDELFSMAGLANRATVVASRANRVADRVTRALPGVPEDDTEEALEERSRESRGWRGIDQSRRGV
jgi:hypothetical protein